MRTRTGARAGRRRGGGIGVVWHEDRAASQHTLHPAFTSVAGAGIGGPRGRIAQLVEQLTLNQRVAGSSPAAPTRSLTAGVVALSRGAVAVAPSGVLGPVLPLLRRAPELFAGRASVATGHLHRYACAGSSRAAAAARTLCSGTIWIDPDPVHSASKPVWPWRIRMPRAPSPRSRSATKRQCSGSGVCPARDQPAPRGRAERREPEPVAIAAHPSGGLVDHIEPALDVLHVADQPVKPE